MQDTGRLFLFSGFVVVAALLALEVAARLTTPESPSLNPRYVRLSEAYPEPDALIADAQGDPGHLGALSPPLVGERSADLVLARLDATGPTP